MDSEQLLVQASNSDNHRPVEEETGDSDHEPVANLDANGGFDGCDDDTESCTGDDDQYDPTTSYYKREKSEELEDDHEDEDNHDVATGFRGDRRERKRRRRKEKEMAWPTWIATVRMEWTKRKEEVLSPVKRDDEDDRLFWETCLASGYPN